MRAITALTLLIVFAAGGWSQPGDDPVRAKLDAAKAAYRAEEQKFHTAVLGHFTKREDTAREAGNKKLVDQIKAEKALYEGKAELPKTLPASDKSKLDTAKKEMAAAYDAAIRDYVKKRQDDLATAVESEKGVFLSGTPKLVPAVVAPKEPLDKRLLWQHKSGYWVKGVGNEWLERVGDYVEIWTETSRDKEVIKMKHMKRDDTLEIHKTKVIYAPGGRNPRVDHIGEWKELVSIPAQR